MELEEEEEITINFKQCIDTIQNYLSEQEQESPKKRQKTQARSKKVTREDVEEALAQLEDLSTSKGFDNDQLRVIISLIRSKLESDLGERTLQRIIHCLVPSKEVAVDCVVDLLGMFSKLSLNMKATTLKWIIMIYDIISQKQLFHKLYGFFFHFLAYESLRPHLTSILFRITRREDVLPFRIRFLYSLQEKSGIQDLSIQILLGLYKEYESDMVILDSNASKSFNSFKYKSLFKIPDEEWFSVISKVQAKYNPLFIISDSFLPFGFKKQSVALLFPGSDLSARDARSKKTKSIIPEVKSRILSSQQQSSKSRKVPIEQITSIHEFAKYVDIIIPPSQLAAVLKNRFLQHYISLDPTKSSILRISHWLELALQQEFFWKDNLTKNDRSIKISMLSAFVEFSNFYQETIPIARSFISEYLRKFNEYSENFEYILKLITLLLPYNFDEMANDILHPISSIFISSSLRQQSTILDSYLSLLHHWISIDWMRFYKTSDTEEVQVEGILRGSDTFTFDPLVNRDKELITSIYKLVIHINQLCIQVVTHLKDDLVLNYSILRFYELTSKLHTRYNLPFVVPPPTEVVSRILLANSAAPISIMCGILAKYKAEFEKLRKQGNKGIQINTTSINPGMRKISLLNAYIWTFCSALWRNKLLVDENPDIQDLYLIPMFVFLLYYSILTTSEHIDILKKENPGFVNSVNITHSPTFSTFAINFFRITRVSSNLPSNISPDLIKDSVKIHYVEYLKSCGLTGLYEFLHTFIGNLVSRRKITQQNL